MISATLANSPVLWPAIVGGLHLLVARDRIEEAVARKRLEEPTPLRSSADVLTA